MLCWLLMLWGCRAPAPDASSTQPPPVDTAPGCVPSSLPSTPDSGTAYTAGTPSTGGTGSCPVVGDGPLQFVGERPRNVLMISMDTFRRDHIGPYGDLALTPTLTELITEGVSASDAMQCSNWTFASTSCTLLGEDHVERGFLPKLTAEYRVPYPEGTRFLATELADAGWYTALSSRNGFLSLQSDVNNAQGYDVVLENLRPASEQLSGGLDHVLGLGGGVPWFLHLHMTEPHAPYDPPEAYLAEAALLEPIAWDLTDNDQVNDLRAAISGLDADELALVRAHLDAHYQAEVRYLDDQLAEGLAAFEAMGLLDDTLVVLWTDHGEQFYEHGYLTHAYDLHTEENDALFALWSRTIVPAVWDGPVSHIDLAPTVMSALGLTPPDRMSGWPLGSAPADRARFAVSVARGEGRNALRRGPHKLIFSWTTGERALFDVVADPLEEVDLFTPGEATSEAMWAELLPYVEATDPLAPEVSITWPSSGG